VLPVESGLPTRRLVVLAASAFVVLAAEPSYLLIDTAVIGHLGTAQLGGLGIAVAVIGLLLVIGEFVEYGTTSRAARASVRVTSTVHTQRGWRPRGSH